MLADDLTPLSLAVMLVVFAVNLAVHEASHAMVARHAGCHVAVVSLGVGPVLLKPQLGSAKVVVRAVPFAGYTLWEGALAARATHVRVALAGPLATLMLAGCMLVLAAPATAAAASGLLAFGALGLVPLIPGSDGARAWAALRRPAAAPPTDR